MGKVAFTDISDTRRDQDKLWLPGLSFDYLERDLAACERCWDLGFAEQIIVHPDGWTTMHNIRIDFPFAGETVDTTLFAGLSLKLEIPCETKKNSSAAGAMRLQIGGEQQDETSITWGSYTWTTFTWTWSSTLPSGWTLIEVQGDPADELSPNGEVYSRRGTATGTPMGRANINLYWDDGT